MSTATTQGTSPYTTTPDFCTCPDYQIREGGSHFVVIDGASIRCCKHQKAKFYTPAPEPAATPAAAAEENDGFAAFEDKAPTAPAAPTLPTRTPEEIEEASWNRYFKQYCKSHQKYSRIRPLEGGAPGLMEYQCCSKVILPPVSSLTPAEEATSSDDKPQDSDGNELAPWEDPQVQARLQQQEANPSPREQALRYLRQARHSTLTEEDMLVDLGFIAAQAEPPAPAKSPTVTLAERLRQTHLEDAVYQVVSAFAFAKQQGRIPDDLVGLQFALVRMAKEFGMADELPDMADLIPPTPVPVTRKTVQGVQLPPVPRKLGGAR